MPQQVEAAPRARARVLLVDDDELIAGTLLQQLTSHGVATDLATDPHLGEQLVRSFDYSVIVVDPYLTGQLHASGTGLVDRIRALRPDARIVILTAYGSHLSEQYRADRGFMVVSKPKPILSMLALIEELLEGGAAVPGRSPEQPVRTVPKKGGRA